MLIGLGISASYQLPSAFGEIKLKAEEIGLAAEAAGFYSFWLMNGYYMNALPDDGLSFAVSDAHDFLNMAIPLMRKRKAIQIGIFVMGNSYNFDPSTLQYYYLVSNVSGGRFYFGIDISRGLEAVEDTASVTEQALQLMHTEWLGKNTLPPHITAGSIGPAETQRIAAQYAEACILHENGGPEALRQSLDAIKDHCTRLGRDYAAIEKIALGTAHLSSGEDTVQTIMERLKNLAGLGFTHTIFHVPVGDEMAVMETFAKEIIPAAAEL